MTHDITTSGAHLFVEGGRVKTLDDALGRLRGKYLGGHKAYRFPIGAEHEVRSLMARLDVPQVAPIVPVVPVVDEATDALRGVARPVGHAPANQAAPAALAPGWSRAAKNRQRGGHPLGDVVEAGDGYTVYEDQLAGRGGRVQLWDQS